MTQGALARAKPNAQLSSWIDEQCWICKDLYMSSRTHPTAGVSQFGSTLVADFKWLYEAGWSTLADQLGACIPTKLKQLGYPLTDDDYTSLGLYIDDLKQRAYAQATSGGVPSGVRPVAQATPQQVAMRAVTTPTQPVTPTPPMTEATCTTAGGTWDSATSTCSGEAAVTPDPLAACAASGGTWDSATSTCLSGGVARAGSLDYPRVRRTALGYDYFALDIRPEAEAAAMASLAALNVGASTAGPLPGVDFHPLTVGGGQVASDWVTAQRSAGLGIIGIIGAGGALVTATNDVSVASALTLTNEAGAVIFEPSGGWVAPGGAASSKTTYIVAGAIGLVAVGGIAWYATRKGKIVKNPRRRQRRRS